jgi:ribosomal protein S18 acetylase RimI-like enzyme
MAGPFVAEAFVVRSCTVADLRQLRVTWPSSADVHDRHFAGQRAGTQTLLVAWDGDRAVGSGVIRWRNSELPEIGDLYPGLVEMAHVYVRPDARGRGVGTCLMQAAEGAARRRGVRWLGLGVDVDNSAAAALYARLGYTSTGVFAHSGYDYVDDDGIEQHAVECNEYLVMELGAGLR